MVMADGYHPEPAMLELFSHYAIRFGPIADIVMRSVYKHAHTRRTVTLIVEIGLR